MPRYLRLLSLALLVLVSACNKYKDYTKAQVIDTGNITPSGCGYLLLLDDGSMRKPIYLPSAFQHDSIRVLVKYSSTGKGSSCNPQMTLDMVDIEDIVRDLD